MLIRPVFGLDLMGALMATLMAAESHQALACSSFALPQSTFLGQNFDWHVGHGQILVNQKNEKKRSLKMFETDQSVGWVSRYGSLTFNQIALDHPISGMNQAGLIVVASENFGEGNAKAENRPTVNEYQWVQYQLDNFATVKEVMDHASEIGISSLLQELHYLVCDATAQCAAFEVSIAHQQLKVYQAGDFAIRVLTDTTYMDALKKYLIYQAHGAPKIQIDPFNSNDRFLSLASKLSLLTGLWHEPFSLDLVLNLLATVKQSGFTQWQFAFDSTAKIIKYQVESTKAAGVLDLTRFDFASDAGAQAVDIHEYIKNSPQAFHPMTHEDNVELVTQSMSYLGSVLPAGGEEKLKSYPAVLETAAIRRILW
jgi:choloylglycine hydrolase